MKALLIQNKDAGEGSTSRKALIAALSDAGWKVELLPRKKANAKTIAAAKADLVVVAGGDGTVASIIKILPDRTLPIAVIPTGTANDIALSLGISGEPDAIIAGWDLKRRRRLDIGNAHGPWGCRAFAEGVGFGAFADSLRIAPDLDGEAKLKAGRRALRAAIGKAGALPLEIRLDDVLLPDDLVLVEVMNIPLTGPRLLLAPHAEPGDGKLHIAFVRSSGREAMARWLELGEGEAPVERCSGSEAVVTGGGSTMRIDDEHDWLEPDSKVTIRLEGEPVQILAPADAPAMAG
jgi:diacylglycerol kinase family enzyme